jgi:hypothetical protein
MAEAGSEIVQSIRARYQHRNQGLHDASRMRRYDAAPAAVGKHGWSVAVTLSGRTMTASL